MAALSLYSEDPWGIRCGVSPYLVQRKHLQTSQEWDKLIEELRVSTTLYVGNLSFYTTEEQIYELFSRCGLVKRVIMGLNSKTKTPCGFCFVEYYNTDDAEAAQKFISGTKLDDRVIRADLDPGFKDGRQFGRSKSGGQVRDDHRVDYDPGRGGWGAKMANTNTNSNSNSNSNSGNSSSSNSGDDRDRDRDRSPNHSSSRSRRSSTTPAKAKREGYRSRAAYKLYQIHNKFKLFKPGNVVIDLGASPGGWSQVATKLIRPSGHVIAVDIQPMEPLTGVDFIHKDFTESRVNILALLQKHNKQKVDIVLSDMAPNATGDSNADHLRIMGLVDLAFHFSLTILKPGGHFITKIYPGQLELKLRDKIRINFENLKYFKPEASHSDSKEIYWVATNFNRTEEL